MRAHELFGQGGFFGGFADDACERVFARGDPAGDGGVEAVRVGEERGRAARDPDAEAVDGARVDGEVGAAGGEAEEGAGEAFDGDGALWGAEDGVGL